MPVTKRYAALTLGFLVVACEPRVEEPVPPTRDRPAAPIVGLQEAEPAENHPSRARCIHPTEDKPRRALLREGPDTMVCLVGPLFSLLARHVEGAEALESVTRVNFAGGPFPWHEREALARVFPRARVFNNYGCAEAMPRSVSETEAPNTKRS